MTELDSSVGESSTTSSSTSSECNIKKAWREREREIRPTRTCAPNRLRVALIVNSRLFSFVQRPCLCSSMHRRRRRRTKQTRYRTMMTLVLLLLLLLVSRKRPGRSKRRRDDTISAMPRRGHKIIWTARCVCWNTPCRKIKI